jgi:hypothetical protein
LGDPRASYPSRGRRDVRQRVVVQAETFATAARAALEQVEARYGAGMLGALEIADAAAADAAARSAVVRARKDRDLSEVVLLSATARLGR